MDNVDSMNSSFSIVDLPLLPLDIPSLEKTKQYSCISLMTGLEADNQLPQAKLAFAPLDFCHMISPLIRNPKSSIKSVNIFEKGIYGFLPRFATFRTSRPPDSVTL